jgi:hypothetical protein
MTDKDDVQVAIEEMDSAIRDAEKMTDKPKHTLEVRYCSNPDGHDTHECPDRKPKHTPGPWVVLEGEPDIIMIHNKRMPIASMTNLGTVKNRSERDANARIIAAAPQMVEALERITNELQAWNSSGDVRPAKWAESRIKIAREALRAAGVAE